MSSHKAPANIRIQVENPSEIEVHVEVALHVPGQQPIIERYDSTAQPPTASAPAFEAPEPQRPVLPRPARGRPIDKLWAWFIQLRLPTNLSTGWLAGAAIAFYLLMRFIGLTEYPANFTADQAISTLQADQFVKNGFRNSADELFPTYFQNIDKYSLGTTVYLQVLTNQTIGWSLGISRGFSVFLGLLAVLGLAFTLKRIFKLRLWWVSILLISMLPAWFLLSRTTYETVVMVAFYTLGFYLYLLYRFEKPAYIYPAIIFFGLGFYAYSPAQVITVLSGLLLGLSDLRYHWQQRKTILLALPLIGLVITPYIRFQLTNPGESWHYLTTLVSYVTFEELNFFEKLAYFIKQYAFLISPLYWFRPETGSGTDFDGEIYLMSGHSLLPAILLLPLVWGLWITLKNFRQPAYRAVLILFLVAPVSAALILSPSSLPRQLLMVIPVTMLTMLGLENVIAYAQKKIASQPVFPVLTGALVLVLVVSNLNLLVDALSGSASIFDDYGESGLQYGAKPVFNLIEQQAQANPQAKFIVTPNWMMFPNLAEAFLLPNSPIDITYASIYDYDHFKKEILPGTLFLLNAQEYQFAASQPKFVIDETIQVIPYPDGEPGFYLTRLAYAPGSDQIFAAEAAEMRQPETAQLEIDGSPASLTYSKTGDGDIKYVFDGDPDSLYKSLVANPVTIEIVFEQPRDISSIGLIHGSSPIELIVEITTTDGLVQTASARYNQNGIAGNTLTLAQTLTAQKITLSVQDLSQGYPGTVHIWEITLK